MSAHITPRWMTDIVLEDIAKHPINAGASEAREMAEEILFLRDEAAHTECCGR